MDGDEWWVDELFQTNLPIRLTNPRPYKQSSYLVAEK